MTSDPAHGPEASVGKGRGRRAEGEQHRKMVKIITTQPVPDSREAVVCSGGGGAIEFNKADKEGATRCCEAGVARQALLGRRRRLDEEAGGVENVCKGHPVVFIAHRNVGHRHVGWVRPQNPLQRLAHPQVKVETLRSGTSE